MQIGDSIRILRVPSLDKKQVQNESEFISTSAVIEKIIKNCPVVIIDWIDENTQPWFSVKIKINGELQAHSLAVMENESWEIVHQINSQKEAPKEHKIASLKKQIDDITEKYAEDYEVLAQESETLYERQEALKKKYEALDQKTRLNALFKSMHDLCSQS